MASSITVYIHTHGYGGNVHLFHDFKIRLQDTWSLCTVMLTTITRRLHGLVFIGCSLAAWSVKCRCKACKTSTSTNDDADHKHIITKLTELLQSLCTCISITNVNCHFACTTKVSVNGKEHLKRKEYISTTSLRFDDGSLRKAFEYLQIIYIVRNWESFTYTVDADGYRSTFHAIIFESQTLSV